MPAYSSIDIGEERKADIDRMSRAEKNRYKESVLNRIRINQQTIEDYKEAIRRNPGGGYEQRYEGEIADMRDEIRRDEAIVSYIETGRMGMKRGARKSARKSALKPRNHKQPDIYRHVYAINIINKITEKSNCEDIYGIVNYSIGIMNFYETAIVDIAKGKKYPYLKDLSLKRLVEGANKLEKAVNKLAKKVSSSEVLKERCGKYFEEKFQVPIYK
jgi:hypothetical protein